jgi:uncharacterized membrane protein YphA (DoxX/SURF4 family)
MNGLLLVYVYGAGALSVDAKRSKRLRLPIQGDMQKAP